MNEQQNNRNIQIDNIKGLLILLAVLGHIVEPLTGPQPYLYQFYAFIYIFHMPAFLLLSGYLSKGGESFNASKIINQLIVPFVVFNFIYEIFYYIQNGEVSNYVKGLAPNWILWFIVSLIFMRIISPIIMQFKYPIALSIAIALMASTVSYNGFTFNASRTLVFMPYYIAGCVLFRSFSGKLTFSERPVGLLIASVFLLACYALADHLNLIALYGSTPLVATGMTLSNTIVVRLSYYVLTALAICSVCFIAARFNWLNEFGKKSLYIYLWHGLIVKCLIWYMLPLLSNNIIIQVATFLITGILLAFLLSRDAVSRFTQLLFLPARALLVKRDKFTVP